MSIHINKQTEDKQMGEYEYYPTWADEQAQKYGYEDDAEFQDAMDEMERGIESTESGH